MAPLAYVFFVATYLVAFVISYPKWDNYTVVVNGTESGGGIAPWAGTGPKPAQQSELISERIVPQNESVSAPEVSPEVEPVVEPETPPEVMPLSAPEILSGDEAVAASSVPVGQIIFSCTVPGTVALTFDDGPYPFTALILDRLRDAGFPATFFVNGDNWRMILSDESQGYVRRMVAEGHQIGSHTWSHPDLATLGRSGIISQMQLLESALRQIIGYYPTYMRSPYFSANGLVLSIMAELGYKVVHADIDTLDWANNSPSTIQNSVQRFRNGLDNGGSIALAHDVHETTARVLTQAMIDEVRARGLRPVTIGDCLGDPRENWYRS